MIETISQGLGIGCIFKRKSVQPYESYRRGIVKPDLVSATATLKMSSNKPAAAPTAEAASSSPAYWLGAPLPRNYTDVTSEVEVTNLDLLNATGSARTLFSQGPPTKGKGASSVDAEKDFVESDTDEQIMLFMPFRSRLKLHSLHITSLAVPGDDEEVSRPKTIKLYTNTQHVLGFEEADDITPVQEIELDPGAWDSAKHTITLPLRFVKFQNVTSLVLFVVEGEGGDRTRIDRVRVIGETGERRELPKWETLVKGDDEE
jgi:hypothetical protein